MHSSLDGFVAGPNGEMDWINADAELFDYASSQTKLADTALYGRITYQMMESYWPTAADQPNATKHDIEYSEWYNRVTKVVVSTTLKGKAGENTRIIQRDVTAEIQKLKEQPGKNILMLGSASTAHLLMQHNLIDEYWIFINPVLLGRGIPLFSKINDRIKLRVMENKLLSSGVVGLQYERLRYV
jgi:dihydrofolate reductase